LKDPFSQEGIEQRIKKGVAEAMREFQKPIQESATKAQQMAKYQDFVAAHPMMQEKAFKTEVRDLMQERKNAGAALTLEDAYALVERNRMVAEQQKQTARDRLKRSESARNVSRSTVSSSNDGGDPVPKWVTEKGYKGSRGNTARILYLRDNPAALQKLRAQQKTRR
jgi:glucan-binding YG repeat protein